MARVAFLGLGVMGYPMAGHLTKAGHQVTVWNRTEAKSEQWAKQYKGAAAASPADAAFGAELVFFCLGDDPDVEAVYEAMEPSIGGGMVIVDHTGVTDSLAGQGVGKALSLRMVEHAREQGFKIIPLCPFFKAMAARNPDWADVVT